MSNDRDNRPIVRGNRSTLGVIGGLLLILFVVGLIWWVGSDRRSMSGGPMVTPATVPSEGQTPAGRTTR